MPGLANVTLTEVMRAAGLSSGYCSRIRRGDKPPPTPLGTTAQVEPKPRLNQKPCTPKCLIGL